MEATPTSCRWEGETWISRGGKVNGLQRYSLNLHDFWSAKRKIIIIIITIILVDA